MMIEYKTASQCISSDYCKGWNDAVKKAEKENKELRAMLKQVVNDMNGFVESINENDVICHITCRNCPFYIGDGEECKYKHMPEIKNLIGE